MLRFTSSTVLAGLLVLGSASARLGGPAPAAAQESSAFAIALASAERALEAGQPEAARPQVMRALERDGGSVAAWGLRARVAEAEGDVDEQVWCLHRELELAVAQELPRAEINARRARLLELDPVAKVLFGMREAFVDELEPLAQSYEKEGRPHSAIRAHREILALAPEYGPSLEAIARISSQPDPTLAEHAEPKDLLADVSAEWMREFDEEHGTWSDRAKHEGENYNVYTDAGYEVLVRCAEAMEQMNAFYRVFFQHGTDGGGVPRIDLLIFKSREEYLEHGSGPPVEWSAGQFTGGTVETYAEGGIEGVTNTLFHEAAHQFVSLATNAAGWLNEGLASFFEGCRLQANGTVVMNMPANHRLFPLVERMERGWMADHEDGIDPANASATPLTAPTFRIVLENRYQWGPPWYAPTWGVVYFLYNFQDPVDGRFVYRAAFREFVDKSGGRMGDGAVENFEQVVLGNPQKPLPGPEREGNPLKDLPRSVEELDPVWKEWLLELRERQMGRATGVRPYLDWARYAIAGKDYLAAMDHFEKGLLETPDDVDLLREFADLLIARGNPDRATKLLITAARLLESAEPVDAKALRQVEQTLAKADPRRATIERVQAKLWKQARAVVDSYAGAERPMMVMHVSRKLSTELGVPDLMTAFEAALRTSGKSIDLWSLAYDESSLEGWDSPGTAYSAAGPFIETDFGEYSSNAFGFQLLALDKVTSGDFSLEADVLANQGEVGFAGLSFGKKGAQNFHALMVFPPKPRSEAREGLNNNGWIDLASFYGGNAAKTWRHSPIPEASEARSSSGTWHRLRIDVVGSVVDAWVDGELIASKRFDSREVLAGSFGLITGPGATRFKEVRFLSRPAGDPTSRVQRELRMESLAEDETPIADSYVGAVPPFPKVDRWVQGERRSWKEAGPVPQLFVLWSIRQNDYIAIDRWLNDLAEEHAAIGLRIVSVVSPNDSEAIGAYLAEHPFPGDVAVDHREGAGIGDTNTAYSTARFGLPRLLLIDVDQKVVWEGDPGFSATEGYRPAAGSYMDDPLEELIAVRKLEELAGWLDRWTTTAQPALHVGDLERALPVLQEGLEFDATAIEAAYEAQRTVAAINSALLGMEATIERLEAEGREPALTTLLEWAGLLELELSRQASGKVRGAKNSKAIKDWGRAQSQMSNWAKKIEKDPAEAEVLAGRLESLSGAFPREIANEVRAAAAAGGAPEVLAVLERAELAPRLWLARQLFGW